MTRPLSFLLATPFSQSWTFEGLFDLTLRPSTALDLASYLASRTSETGCGTSYAQRSLVQ